MKASALLLVVLLGGLLIYCSFDFPSWGDPGSPASLHVSPYYIEHGEAETHAPNLVTAVLADYRGYDTMFETVVIFAAGIACIGPDWAERGSTACSALANSLAVA